MGLGRLQLIHRRFAHDKNSSLWRQWNVVLWTCSIFLYKGGAVSYLLKGWIASSVPMFIAALLVGNCDIHAERKILFANEMNRYKSQPRLTGWVQIIFQIAPPNFVKCLDESWLKCWPLWMKVREMEPRLILWTHNMKVMSKDKNVNIAATYLLNLTGDGVKGKFLVCIACYLISL
jgi:hypothetical protein